MDTNRREWFRPESLRGFGVRRSAKGRIRPSELDAALIGETSPPEIWRHLAYLADK
jgi:hypothetical protein